ncbi:MAG: hypothetical protein WAU89_19795 [Candidatus Acidiferrales bacterium]
MDINSETLSTSVPAEVSLVRGGPSYRIQRAVDLIRKNQWNLGCRITFLIVVGWLPLLLITATSNFEALPSLLRDYREKMNSFPADKGLFTPLPLLCSSLRCP